MPLSINREQSIELLKKYNNPLDKSDWNHFLESEAIMKELAKKLNEDIIKWGNLGLLHDIDWGITKHDSSKHLTLAPNILKNAGFDLDFINTIISHGYGFDCAELKDKKRTKKEEFALSSSETLTGLISAYAKMRQNKISDMELSGLKKKFKDKAFAAGCNREIIKECENLGISLDEFLQIGIDSLKKIKDDIGLS